MIHVTKGNACALWPVVATVIGIGAELTLARTLPVIYILCGRLDKTPTTSFHRHFLPVMLSLQLHTTTHQLTIFYETKTQEHVSE